VVTGKGNGHDLKLMSGVMTVFYACLPHYRTRDRFRIQETQLSAEKVERVPPSIITPGQGLEPVTLTFSGLHDFKGQSTIDSAIESLLNAIFIIFSLNQSR